MKATLLFAKTQLLRVSRDIVTLIVLFSIPLVLLLVFGAFTANTNNVSLRVAVVNNSEEAFAQQFEKSIDGIDVLKQEGNELSLNEARDKLKDDDLDAVIELPKEFGAVSETGPSGKIKVYVDESSMSTGDIVMGVMNSVVEQTNTAIVGSEPPIAVERAVVEGKVPVHLICYMRCLRVWRL